MENKYYWRYYRSKQKAEKMKKELEKLQKELQNQKEQTIIYTRLVFALVRYLRGETVNAERISNYRKALSDLKKIAKPEEYNLLAPVCERIIAELEKRLQAKR
jgi:UDP-N-acetylmuramoylalanine-D-glutamate ligase